MKVGGNYIGLGYKAEGADMTWRLRWWNDGLDTEYVWMTLYSYPMEENDTGDQLLEYLWNVQAYKINTPCSLDRAAVSKGG